ncbi:MAG: response regulator transcription factor [Aggregatilineales bacterium]
MTKKRLLVIEDDHDVAEMLIVYFSGQGYDVHHALTGKDGVNLARSRFPNLILLDVMLPDMDGFDVCRALRTITLTKHIPTIFLTQRDGRSDKVSGLQLGADDYVTKPFDVEELRLRVQSSLRRSTRELLHDPRTGLPTGALVEDGRRQIEGKTGWTTLDIRLTGLKDFRDQYSFIAADEALAFAAQSIISVANRQGTPEDFVGMIGEDQFVLLTRAADVSALTQALAAEFKDGVKKLYHFADSERGYLLIPDGDKPARQSPLMSLMISQLESAAPVA